MTFQSVQGNNAGQNFENDRTYPANNPTVYPTTPSTFPHSVFQSMHPGQQQDYLTSRMASPTAGTYAPGSQGYFTGTNYQTSNSQAHYGNQAYPQQSLTSPQPFSPRTLHANDPNAGLASQFSHQHLGVQNRANGPGGRQPSPLTQGSRPNTQQGHGSHLSPLSTGASYSDSSEDRPPPQDPNKYSSNVNKRVVGLHLHVEKFFTQNISRARERNMRYV